MEPTSDTQFIAQMLVKTRKADQVTRAEEHRLNEIAEHGRTVGSPIPSNHPVLIDPETMEVVS